MHMAQRNNNVGTKFMENDSDVTQLVFNYENLRERQTFKPKIHFT